MGHALHADGTKNRADHRHHALDAVAIALSSPAVVKRMAEAARRGMEQNRDGRLLQFTEPWPRFLEELKEALDNVNASHRPDRRLSGPLHEETNYSKPLQQSGGAVHRRRKPLDSIAIGKLADIPDSKVREAVRSHLDRADVRPGTTLGGPDFRPGETVRHVRMPADRVPVSLVTEKAHRYVAPASNHHMAVYAVGEGEDERWAVEVVTRLEAHRRKRDGEPIVRRDRGDGARFLFSLRSGDSLSLLDDNGSRALLVVRGVSGEGIEALRANDGRPLKQVRAEGSGGGRIRLTAARMRDRRVEKVDVSPIGEVTRSHE
jgi:CRISPR-associated endonuclease Csn1